MVANDVHPKAENQAVGYILKEPYTRHTGKPLSNCYTIQKGEWTVTL